MSVELQSLFAPASMFDLAAGQVLFRADTPVRRMFLVVDGQVHLRRHTRHGAEMVLHRAGPGTVIAEASAYASHYHCDAIATQAAKVAALPKSRFLQTLANDPMLAAGWAALLARSVQGARLRSEIRSLPRVADRLDAWFAAGHTLPTKGQWQSVAAELGVTREALYRELARRRRA